MLRSASKLSLFDCSVGKVCRCFSSAIEAASCMRSTADTDVMEIDTQLLAISPVQHAKGIHFKTVV